MRVGSRWSKKSVFTKLLGSYILLFLVPLTIFGLISLGWITDLVRAETANVYAKLSQNLGENVDQVFKDANDFTHYISRERWFRNLMLSIPDDTEANPARALERLNYYRISNPYIDEIAIFFHDREFILTSSLRLSYSEFFKYVLVLNGRQPEYLREKLERERGEELLLPYEVQDIDGNRGFLHVSTFPVHRQFDLRASVFLFVRQTHITRILAQMTLPETTSVVFERDERRVVAAAGEVAEEALSEIVRDVTAASERMVAGDGVEYLPQLVNLESAPLTLAVFAPLKRVTTSVRHAAFTLAGILLALVFIGVVLSYWLSLSGLKPLRKLQAKLQHSTHRRPPTNQDEFAWIEASINSLVQEEHELRSRVELQKRRLADFYVRQVLEGRLALTPDTRTYLKEVGLRVPSPLYACCVTTLPRDTVLGQLPHGGGVWWYAVDISGTTCCLACFDEREAFDSSLSVLQKRVVERVSLEHTVAVGRVCDELTSIPTSYFEAQIALGSRRILRSRAVLPFANIDKRMSFFHYPEDVENRLKNYLRQGCFREAVDEMDSVVKHNARQATDSLPLRYVLSHVAMTAMQVTDETGGYASVYVDVQRILQSRRVEETRAYIVEVFSEICRHSQELKSRRGDSEIADIRAYVDDNLTNRNLSLTYVADHFDVTVSYLSRVFKDASGSSFHEYVSRARLALAAQMLREPESRVKDVLESVGYTNDVTFRRLFRKYYGVTPNEYRSHPSRNPAM